MASKKLRQVLTLSLCAVARPAFADGTPLVGGGKFVAAIVVLVVTAVAAVVLLAVLARWLTVRRMKREAKPEPPVPVARVVNERDRSSDSD